MASQKASRVSLDSVAVRYIIGLSLTVNSMFNSRYSTEVRAKPNRRTVFDTSKSDIRNSPLGIHDPAAVRPFCRQDNFLTGPLTLIVFSIVLS